MALAARFGWAQIRIEDVNPDSVRARLGRDSYVLNLLCDFLYAPEVWESNVLVFDHHDPQNPTDRCSAHQLMEELVRQGLMREIPSLMEQISAWDVVGPQAIPVNDRPEPDKYTAILAAEPSEGFDPKTASFILAMLERSFSIRQFINELFSSETSFGETARTIYADIQAKREEALADIVDNAVLKISSSGVRYASLEQNPAGMLKEVFSRLEADIVIHPNERTVGALSIVRDSNGKYATTPVAELVEVANEQVVFQHPGGFLLVAYPPVVIK
jgi:hypothetical protein